MSNKKHFVRCEDDCLVEGMTKEQIVSAIVEATGNTPTLSEDAFITKIVNQNGGAMKLWIGTNAEYNALTEKDAGTCYIINDAKTPNEAYNIAKEAKELSNHALLKVNNTLSLNGGVMNGNVCFTDHDGHYWGIGCVEGDKLGFGCVEDPNNAPDIEPVVRIDKNGVGEFLGASKSLYFIETALKDVSYTAMLSKPTGLYYFLSDATGQPESGKRGIILHIIMNISGIPTFTADLAFHNTKAYYRWSGASSENGWKALND